MQILQQLTENEKRFCTILTILFSPIAALSVISKYVHGKWRLIVFPSVLTLQGMAFKTDILLGLAAGVVAAGSIATLNDTAGIALQLTRYVMGLLGWRFNDSHETQKQAMLEIIELESPSVGAFISRAENEFGFSAMHDVLTSPDVKCENGILVRVKRES